MGGIRSVGSGGSGASGGRDSGAGASGVGRSGGSAAGTVSSAGARVGSSLSWASTTAGGLSPGPYAPLRRLHPREFWAFDVLDPAHLVTSYWIKPSLLVLAHIVMALYLLAVLLIERFAEQDVGPWWATYFTHWNLSLFCIAAALAAVNTARHLPHLVSSAPRPDNTPSRTNWGASVSPLATVSSSTAHRRGDSIDGGGRKDPSGGGPDGDGGGDGRKAAAGGQRSDYRDTGAAKAAAVASLAGPEQFPEPDVELGSAGRRGEPPLPLSTPPPTPPRPTAPPQAGPTAPPQSPSPIQIQSQQDPNQANVHHAGVVQRLGRVVGPMAAAAASASAAVLRAAQSGRAARRAARRAFRPLGMGAGVPPSETGSSSVGGEGVSDAGDWEAESSGHHHNNGGGSRGASAGGDGGWTGGRGGSVGGGSDGGGGEGPRAGGNGGSGSGGAAGGVRDGSGAGEAAGAGDGGDKGAAGPIAPGLQPQVSGGSGAAGKQRSVEMERSESGGGRRTGTGTGSGSVGGGDGGGRGAGSGSGRIAGTGTGGGVSGVLHKLLPPVRTTGSERPRAEGGPDGELRPAIRWDVLSLAHQLTMEVSVVCALFLTLFYWGGLVGLAGEPYNRRSAANYMKHAGNSVLALAQVVCTRLPIVSYHFTAVLLYLASYVVFVWIYGEVGGTWRYALNWERLRGTVGLAVLVVLQLIMFLIWYYVARVREWRGRLRVARVGDFAFEDAAELVGRDEEEGRAPLPGSRGGRATQRRQQAQQPKQGG
ncbi:hypothetical protein GPECTOR_74g691 [Gonium pectorale]|uniref:Uncharacterized protein n=1 Tax=Gonium pectorale TaxID=33097 RepID=A0A150G2K1_GONPE|nr:hypothetical protein GPECTOR_74g691 [Gonium pectorale]|eukprot:KXZ44077.1 hypothetical protein GPECTOR_74g691 [Gonium pectorale]